MPRLAGMLEAGERGQFADLQWLYYFMERSDSYFEFSPVASDQTRQVVQAAVDLSKAGLKMDAGEVAEKTGYRVEG